MKLTNLETKMENKSHQVFDTLVRRLTNNL
jgi:hypothetical protein